MINANELRIGNWVRTSEYHNKITSLGTDACHTTARERKVLHTYEFVHPIPLTPEILEQCGFKTGEESWIKGMLHVAMRDGIFKMWYGSMNNSSIVSVQHLHQLQNLYFALFGKELTINP